MEEESAMSIQRELLEKHQKEVLAFKSLLERFRGVHDISSAERAGLAFIIDDMYRVSSEQWEKKYGDFTAELEQTGLKEGVPGMTWRLAQELQSRYSGFLQKIRSESVDQSERNGIDAFLKRSEFSFSYRRKAYEAKRAVPIGTVALRDTPTWLAAL